MEIEDYTDKDSGEIGTPVSVERRAREKYSISNAGALGRNILNDIVNNITGLTPISGRIHIEVDIGIEDKRWFGDDTEHRSKLIIEVGLDKKVGGG